LLAHGRWFSPCTPASSTIKTGRHDITEILLKVALNTKINQIKSNQELQPFFGIGLKFNNTMMHNKWFANLGVVGHAQYPLVKLNTCIPLVGIGCEMGKKTSQIYIFPQYTCTCIAYLVYII